MASTLNLSFSLMAIPGFEPNSKTVYGIQTFYLLSGEAQSSVNEKTDNFVCVVHPVMPFIRMNLDTVARIQAVFVAVQIYGQDTLQNVDKFFTVVLIHLKLVFRACGGGRHQVEDTRKTGESLCISIDQVLYDLGG